MSSIRRQQLCAELGISESTVRRLLVAQSLNLDHAQALQPCRIGKGDKAGEVSMQSITVAVVECGFDFLR